MHPARSAATSRAMLERERAAAQGVRRADLHVRALGQGGLHRPAEGCGADLLVVGSCSRRSVGRLLCGDATRGSLSGAPCAVAIATPGYAERSGSIDAIGVAYNDTLSRGGQSPRRVPSPKGTAPRSTL